jgi:hypothetical protein
MRTTQGNGPRGSKKPAIEPNLASFNYHLADNEYMQHILQQGHVSQFEAESDRTEDEQMKKLTRKKNTAPSGQENEAMETAPAPVGHNSVSEQKHEATPDQLETLREILVGPSQTMTETRLKELLLILEEREEDLSKREEMLQQQITYVQSDVTEREQALNKKISQVEAELAAREEALYQKVANVERELAAREQSLDQKLSELDTQIGNCKAANMRMDMDFTASLSLANKQQDSKIRDVGHAISMLGDQIAQMCDQAPSEAAE